MRVIRILAALASGSYLMMSGPVSAQETTMVCRADARAFCRPESLTRSRETIQVCLERNLDQISRDCRTLIQMQPKPPADRRPVHPAT